MVSFSLAFTSPIPHFDFARLNLRSTFILTSVYDIIKASDQLNVKMEITSRKNHIITASGVLCTDKPFSHSKIKQKEKINIYLYEEYALLYDKNKLPPDSRYNDEILFKIQEKIEKSGIWLPCCGLKKYFCSRKNKFRKRFEKANASEDYVFENYSD